MAVTGIVDRMLGRGVAPASFLSRFGKGAQMMLGGGNLQGGVQLSATGIGNGADTTEDTLFTFTLPTPCLDVPNRELFIQAFGTIAATSATKHARVYFGSTTLVDFAATTTQTGTWSVTASIWKSGANAQVGLVQTDTTISGSQVRAVSVITPTETDTAGIVIKVTGQSSANTANLIVCNGLIIAGYN